MKDRIFKVMKWSGLNLSQFAEAIQVSPALLSSVKSERTKPTLLLVENIKKVYPSIDINWLITGEGSMIAGNVGGLVIATEEEEKPEKAPAPAPTPAPEPVIKREVVTVSAKPAEKEPETRKEEHKKEPVRAVRQVLLMYNDGTYESFEK